MKKVILSLVVAAIAPFALAQTSTVTTTTTTGTGTITEWTPGTGIVVKETTGPVRYTVREKVTYATKSGKVLTDDEVKTRIKVGAPVSVRYVKDGETMVVNHVEIDD